MRPAFEKRQGTKSRREVVRQQGRGLYGDLARGRDLKAARPTAFRLERAYNLDVMARILLNGEFTFCPTHDFNGLSVAKEQLPQLCAMSFPTSFGRQNRAN